MLLIRCDLIIRKLEKKIFLIEYLNSKKNII
jgi:hypothetical protein